MAIARAELVPAAVVVVRQLEHSLLVAHGEEVVGRLDLPVADDVEVACEREAEGLVERAALLGIGDPNIVCRKEATGGSYSRSAMRPAVTRITGWPPASHEGFGSTRPTRSWSSGSRASATTRTTAPVRCLGVRHRAAVPGWTSRPPRRTRSRLRSPGCPSGALRTHRFGAAELKRESRSRCAPPRAGAAAPPGAACACSMPRATSSTRARGPRSAAAAALRNKPFCDGSHKTNGFEGLSAADALPGRVVPVLLRGARGADRARESTSERGRSSRGPSDREGAAQAPARDEIPALETADGSFHPRHARDLRLPERLRALGARCRPSSAVRRPPRRTRGRRARPAPRVLPRRARSPRAAPAPTTPRSSTSRERTATSSGSTGSASGRPRTTAATGGSPSCTRRSNPSLEGHGFGSRLATAALDDARDKGSEVVPLCPFIAAFIDRHGEYEDLVAPGYRARHPKGD